MFKNIFVCLFDNGERQVWAIYCEDKQQYDLHGNEDGTDYLGYTVDTLMQAHAIVNATINLGE